MRGSPMHSLGKISLDWESCFPYCSCMCVVLEQGLTRADNWSHFFESVLDRVPFINTVYQSIKQLMSTLFSEQATHFQEVVLVEYPRKGIYCFAFLTNENHFLEVSGQKLLSIFLPSTPNPTTGFYLLLPQDAVWNVDLTVEEAFKLIMSAGIVTPDVLRTATPYVVARQDSSPSDAKET